MRQRLIPRNDVFHYDAHARDNSIQESIAHAQFLALGFFGVRHDTASDPFGELGTQRLSRFHEFFTEAHVHEQE